MPPFDRTRAKELLYEALESELGICIEVEPESALAVQNKVYVVRTELNDPDLMLLSTHIAPDGRELWIYKRAEAKLD